MLKPSALFHSAIVCRVSLIWGQGGLKLWNGSVNVIVCVNENIYFCELQWSPSVLYSKYDQYQIVSLSTECVSLFVE